MTISATYLTLQRAIADELGDRSDLLTEVSGSLLSSSPIKRAIASAIAKWERESFYFNETYTSPLFTTVSGQEIYTTVAAAGIADSPDIWSLHALVSGNYYEMERLDWNELENSSINTTSRGQPDAWAWFGSQIRLYPIPNGAYPIRAIRTSRVAALASDADTNVWTNDAYDLIRSEAKLILARDVMHDPTLAAECTVAIYGNPAMPRDVGYLGALKAETVRRARSRIRPSRF